MNLNFAARMMQKLGARGTEEELEGILEECLRAEIERLRAALERIANGEPNGKWARDEAREALSE